MSKRATPDWAKIKTEYLRGGTSYRKLAEKHNTPENTLRKRAAREKWGEDRHKIGTEVARKIPQKIADVILSEAEEWTRESLRMASVNRKELFEKRNGDQVVIGFTREGVEREEIDFLNSPKDWKSYADALASIDRIGRKALGLEGKAFMAGGQPPLEALTQAILMSQDLIQAQDRDEEEDV